MSEDTITINNQSKLPIGTFLQGGKYRIDRYLASGGFGNTYAATNTEFEEQVAIKEFYMKGITARGEDSVTVTVSNSENLTSFNELKRKFKKEARRLRHLKNNHIVAVHDLFEENETAYYVMDLINGESLAERQKRLNRPLTESEIIPLLWQALDALEAVHAQQIWHLDIKPSNLMISADDQLCLIDFGASKQLYTADGRSLSTSAALAYTPRFAPLEQIDQNLRLFGPWTDFYALGATLYKLLTGSLPLTSSEIAMGDILSFPTGISRKMQDLITWMMKSRYYERPQSVEEIRAFLQGVRAGKGNNSGSTNNAEKPKTLVKKGKGLWWGLIATIVVFRFFDWVSIMGFGSEHEFVLRIIQNIILISLIWGLWKSNNVRKDENKPRYKLKWFIYYFSILLISIPVCLVYPKAVSNGWIFIREHSGGLGMVKIIILLLFLIVNIIWGKILCNQEKRRNPQYKFNWAFLFFALTIGLSSFYTYIPISDQLYPPDRMISYVASFILLAIYIVFPFILWAKVLTRKDKTDSLETTKT